MAAAREPTDAELTALAEPFHAQARAMLAKLTPADATPATKQCLVQLVGSVLLAWDLFETNRVRRERIVETLASLSEICVAIPRRLDAIEQQLDALKKSCEYGN